jgi:hypothetical protein
MTPGRDSRPLRDERMAANEALFREVNERIFDATAALGDWPWGAASSRIDFVCECGHAECFEQIPLTREEYERIRASPRRFVIKGGHEMPELEHEVDVPAGPEGIIVVEKEGAAARVAEEYAAPDSPLTDPQRPDS